MRPSRGEPTPAPHPPLDLSRVVGSALEAGTKGVPAALVGRPLAAVRDAGLDLLSGDLPTPVAVLRQDLLDHDLAWMSTFCASQGVAWAPHGKTHMAPQVMDAQLRAGAWGITAATGAQLRLYRSVGVQRILVANQLVDRDSIRFVLDELRRDPALELCCLVDSVELVDHLVRMIGEVPPVGRPLELLVELGTTGARTGCRTVAEAIVVARAVAEAAPLLALRGVETYEGLLAADDRSGIQRLLADTTTLAGEVAGVVAQGPMVLTAGGSCHLDLVAPALAAIDVGRPLLPIIRSGCVATSDHGRYGAAMAAMRERSPWLADGQGEGLRPALTVWAMVQSRPEEGLVLLTAGRRDVSHDAGLPVPLAWARPGSSGHPSPLADHVVVALSDQHAHVRCSAASPLAVGDLVQLGISHPCSTFDRWPVLLTVDDALRVTGAVRTYF